MHVGFQWGNLKVKLPVGRLRQRLEDSSEMDFKRNRMGGGGLICLAEDKDKGHGSCEHRN
jgi:hypothetical protein